MLPGRTIDANEMQEEKAYSPIVVTLSGMEIYVDAEPPKPLSKIPSAIIPLEVARITTLEIDADDPWPT